MLSKDLKGSRLLSIRVLVQDILFLTCTSHYNILCIVNLSFQSYPASISCGSFTKVLIVFKFFLNHREAVGQTIDKFVAEFAIPQKAWLELQH